MLQAKKIITPELQAFLKSIILKRDYSRLACAPALFISSSCSLTIGEISGGCHLAFLASSGQVKGRSKTCPGSRAFSNTDRASNSTSLCPSLSPTCPTGRPYGYSIAAILGKPSSRLYSGVMVRARVEKPFPSRKRATSPTDRQHRGQAGVSRTASTCSFLIREATFGSACSSSSLGSSWKP